MKENQFTFAGFTFPKYVWTLPNGSFAQRLARSKNRVTGPYYHAPKPNSNGGIGFYLDNHGMPGLRWQWADECEDVRIDHSGWFTDEYGDSETIRGLVMRLPKGRGFLAGWSMGEGMASEIDSYVYETEKDAAYAANSMAESAADHQREHNEKWQEAQELEWKADEKLSRLRECLALRNNRCFEKLRSEAAELIEEIRDIRESLQTQYADVC